MAFFIRPSENFLLVKSSPVDASNTLKLVHLALVLRRDMQVSHGLRFERCLLAVKLASRNTVESESDRFQRDMIFAMKTVFMPILFGSMMGFLATYLLVRDRDMGPLVIRGVADGAMTIAPDTSFEEERAMIADLQGRLEQNPQDLLLLSDLANLHFTVQDFPAAITYYRRSLDIVPDDVNLRTDLGTALYYSARLTEALAEFERVLESEPGHPQTLFNMGVVLLETQNDTEGAIALWQRLIDLNPGYAQNPMVQGEIDRLRSSR